MYMLALPLLRLYLRRSRRSYVLLNNGGQYLFIRNFLNDGRWSLPGGGAHRGENPKEAAVRELAEELSVAVRPEQLRLVTEGIWRTNNLGFRYRIYAADFKDRTKISRRWPEIVSCGWLDPKELDPRDCPAEILAALAAGPAPSD